MRGGWISFGYARPPGRPEFPAWGPCFTMEVSGGEQELARYAKKDTGRTWLTVTAGEAPAAG